MAKDAETLWKRRRQLPGDPDTCDKCTYEDLGAFYELLVQEKSFLQQYMMECTLRVKYF